MTATALIICEFAEIKMSRMQKPNYKREVSESYYYVLMPDLFRLQKSTFLKWKIGWSLYCCHGMG